MAKKYLDDAGVLYFWGKLKAYFQPMLVSGANIKTINNTSLLGSGNISIGAGITVLDCYPVGSYFETRDANFNPNTAWGGTWVLEIEGQVHVSAGTNYPVSGALTNTSDGGEAEVTLTTNQIPSHTHSSASLVNIGGSTTSAQCARGTNYGFGYGNPNYIGSTGGGQAHNNMQPHINVYRWLRTA